MADSRITTQTGQEVNSIEAIVAALQHCAASQRTLCSVLCASSSLRSAVLSSCRGCLDVNLELHHLGVAMDFCYWYADHSVLVRSITLCLKGCWLSWFSGPLLSLQRGLAVGFRAAAAPACQESRLCPLQSFSANFPCGPHITNNLPARSITSLSLNEHPVYDPHKIFQYSPILMGAAIGSLTSLRSLHLGLGKSSRRPLPEEDAAAYCKGLARLTQLTKLELHSTEAAFLAHTQYLPPTLVELQLLGQFVEAPSSLQLSHLTAVTRLDLRVLLPPACSLPSQTLQLAMCVSSRYEAATLASSMPHVRCCSLALGDVGRHISLLASLTAMTSLEMSTSVRALPELAPSLRCLPGLNKLTFCRDDDFQGEDILSPEVLGHLAAATTLTSLALQYDHEPDGEPFDQSREDAKNACAYVARLQQLQHLDLCGLLVAGSARHLAQLTQLTALDLRFCEITDQAAVALGIALTRLVELKLSANKDLSDACAPALAQLTGLTKLELEFLPGFTEEGLQELSTLRSLRELKVDERDLAEGAVEALWAAIRQ